MSIEVLPDFPLETGSPVGVMFIERGIKTFRRASRHVRDLPYGRNTDRSDWRYVLAERRGTCSTKHALLAQLAKEHGSPVKLQLGIYEMDPENTPGIRKVLESSGVDRIPEAHCYLMYRDERIDLTNIQSAGEPEFLHEEEIAPEQIGAYKVQVHQRFMRDRERNPNLDFEQVWKIREDCISALSTDDC